MNGVKVEIIDENDTKKKELDTLVVFLEGALKDYEAIVPANNIKFEEAIMQEIDVELQAIPDIESMTIERFYNKFINSNGMAEHRFVVLGIWTVDIKKGFKFLTLEPQNAQMQRKVVRGQSHVRNRPSKVRFVVGSEIDSLIKRSATEYDPYWLGNTWAIEYNGWDGNRYNLKGYFPSINQVIDGLIGHALEDFELSMGKIDEQKVILEASNNILQTW